MKFPISWLKSYLPLDLSPSEIGNELTMIGFELEGIESFGLTFSGIVVGEVLEAEPHPSADTLTLTRVTDGTTEYSVICGAPNCRKGLRVAFARPGSVLQDAEGKDFTIESRKLRGVLSEGMLCAHDELSLPKEPYGVANGIMELDESFEVGQELASYFGDPVLEIGLTPNLAYGSNIRGLARELAAAKNQKLQLPTFSIEESSKKNPMKVRIEESALCPRYACRVVHNVKVGPSPDWLRDRLEASGVRSINNVVDVTNFVMLEIGQPMHAFDFPGKEIVVRCARKGEKVTTLDGVERFPTEDMLLICDASKPLAIAGVMGSAESEVKSDTTTVLLEAAYFQPSSVRRTSKRLGLQTDASYRFERGTDPNSVCEALDRAAMLLAEVANGEAASGIVDQKEGEFPPKKIAVRAPRVNQILGTQLAMGEIETIFRRIDFKVTAGKDETLHVQVPFYRHDITGEIDLVEEVARFYGFHNIPKKEPPLYRSNLTGHDPAYLFEVKLRDLLLREGLQELLTCDLISAKEAEAIAPDAVAPAARIHLRNPASADQSILRPSLLPSLLRVVGHNRDHDIHHLNGFEIGKLHLKAKDDFLEPKVASIILFGEREMPHWSQKNKTVDFFDLKGIVENVLSNLNVQVQFARSSHANFHPGRQASVIVNGQEAGIIGEVHPKTAALFDIESSVYFAELHMEELQKATSSTKRMQPLPQFPSSSRDWTVTLPNTLHIQKIFDLAEQSDAKLLEKVSLIDVYHSDKLGSEVKNMTLRFIYRDRTKTISINEVEREHTMVTEKITREIKEGEI